MAKSQAISGDKKVLDLGSEYSTGDKKPNWVNLAQLDGPLEDSLTNRFLYKPALRFHGITGGIWGQGLSDAHSVTSESRPPSYRFVDSMTSPQQGGDGCSTCDVDTLYNTMNIPARSPLTLRRRNTMAVIVVAIALLAAVAAITGVILHFLHPKAMLRANVRFTIANKNYTDDMKNSSSLDFHELARPLCEEMDIYFLTSELADFYLGCNVVSMRKEKSDTKFGTAVHYTLDFIENKVTNDGERIKKIIMRKSGRQKTAYTLYLAIRDFLVYLRSLKVGVEVLPLPDDHPGGQHRPRIPWNEDIDFIARKSIDVNHNGTNATILTDNKELTQNITEHLERNIDIPRMVLPGGEIHDLPIITQTPFHHSVTPRLHAHALHLQSVVKEMPVLSQMFKNVSVSSVVNAFKTETVIHGAGAFINPTSVSVSVFVPTNDAHLIGNIPTIQEINVKNGGVKAQKIINNDDNTNRQTIHKHDSFVNSIETSFKDISDNFEKDFIKTTELLHVVETYRISESVASSESSQKIFTLLTDVFLIMGSNSGTTNEIGPTPTISLPNHINMQTQLNEFIEDKVGVEKKPISSFPSRFKHTSNDSLAIAMAITPIKNPTVHDTFTENQTGNTKSAKIESVNKVINESITDNNKMELNELVVGVPVQEAIVPIAENVQWINIFNEPQRTMEVHVGDILSSNGMIQTNESPFKEPVLGIDESVVEPGTDVASVIDISNGMQVQALSEGMHNDQSTHDSQNVVGSNLQFPKTDQSIIFDHLGEITDTHTGLNSGIGKNLALPNVVTRHRSKVQPNKDPYYRESSNNMMIQPHDTDANVSWKRLQNHAKNIGKPNSISNKKNTKVTFLNNEGTAVNSFDRQLKGISPLSNKRNRFDRPTVSNTQTLNIQANGKPRSSFNVRNSLLNGRTALVVSRDNGATKNRKVQFRQNNKMNTNSQPWNFLNRIGINLAYFNPDIVRRRNIVTGNMEMPDTKFRSQRLIANLGTVDSNGTIPGTRTGSKFRGRFQRERLLNTDRFSLNPYQQFSMFNRGLPKSPGFKDIEDMKRILKQLVDNMFNMTTKIDHMQDAINFINKTFHETHRPLFNLEETLGNMTVSLGNLNQNLNSINLTMNAFKDFLKQFGNKVFNIDDVIKHIDDTIGNLENAVSFIEFSMVDINGTVNGISDNIIDMNNTLTYVNRSVLDVNYTATYSNDTLDSMQQTLISLEDAIKSLSLKINVINNESDVFDISLKNINDTVKNTHGKLNRLHGKMMKFNSSMSRVVDQAHRLNETYNKINKTLENMNEPYMFINGTVLEVIEKLSTIDGRLLELSDSMDVAQSNITVMNASLLSSMDWLEEMVKTLTKFNLWMESNDNEFQISLHNKDVIETVGMLLKMNGTLSEIGHDVDHINIRLDKVDSRLENLEEQLLQIDRTLDDIDVKFKLLDKTLKSINTTVKDTDSSLKVINSTIKAMETVFEKGRVSFANINDTLDTVNKTLTMINNTAVDMNSTITSVNKTFDGLESTVNRTTGSAIKLMESILKFQGTVRDLNTQLYNANESMRITVNKADIAIKSYSLLNETLTEVDNTVAKLRTKLEETNGTLLNTTTSLGFVNNSILSLQNSFQILSTDLSKIQDSFIKMNNSVHGFGEAFPTIQTSIQETQDSMFKLQEDISRIDEELHNHEDKRDSLVIKKLFLNNKLKLVADKLDLIQSTLEKLKDRSNEIENNIVVLNGSVNNAVRVYDKAEENIRFINDSHDKIMELYDKFQKHAIQTNDSLNTLDLDIRSLDKDFNACRIILENYSNIDINLDIISSDIETEVLKYENVKENFNNWEQQFKNVNKVIWDENGSPSQVHTEYKTLVNNTEMVNKTVDNFGQVLNDTDNDVTRVLDFNNHMRSKLKDLYNLQYKIDVIENTEMKLSKQITETNNILNGKNTSVSKIKDALLEKLKYINDMKDKFGNVNGSFNSTEQFQDLEKDLRSTLDDVYAVINSLENSSKVFQTVVHNFNEAITTYHSNVYDLSEESQIILNNTLDVMNDTRMQNNDVDIDLLKLSDTIDKIEKRINNSSSEITNFEKTLDYHKTKNNFITSKRPLLEEAFQRAFKQFKTITKMQETLSKDLKSLQNTSEVVEKHIKEKPNVNISISEENRNIKDFTKKIMDFGNDLSTADVYLNTFYERFLDFNESKYTLEEIQKEYAQHYHAVEHFQTVVKNIPFVQSDIFTKATQISTTFDDLLRQLSEFYGLEEPVNDANVSVNEVKTKLGETWGNVHDAESHLSLLKDEYVRIKSNYTNFTATDIDLTQSYINEAMADVDERLTNLTSDLLEANGSVNSLQLKFATVGEIYTQKIYNRSNIDDTIKHIIVPSLQDISEQSRLMNDILDTINSKIRTLDTAIKGVNETIHVTDKQLFIDRQKKLLADTKFPELEKSTENANLSLTNSFKRLDETSTDLKDIIKTYEELEERLKNYPKINISLDDLDRKLHTFNESISATLDELNANADLLNKLNETLWIKDGKRYSNSETVDDMKKRYKHVDDILNQIYTNMSDINSVIDSINNESEQIAARLSSLNATLDGVDKSNKLFGNLYNELSVMDVDFENVTKNVKELTHNFSDITEVFKTMETRFAKIKQSVYRENVDQFMEDESSINKSLSSLDEAAKITSKDLGELQNLFDLIKLTMNKTSRSQKDIEEHLYDQNNILKNISVLLRTVEKSIDGLKNKSSHVEPSIHKLENNRSIIEKTFYRQEKLDYFDKHFPKIAYDNLNDTLSSVIKANSDLGSHAKLLGKHFDELKLNMSKLKNVNFDISQIYDSVLSAENLVMNNTNDLHNILNNYLGLKALLFADDGLEVSDAETIDAMKKRYETIGSRVKNMTFGLLSMKSNIGKHNSILEQNADTIVMYQKLITSYENVSRNINGIRKSNENWNTTANDIQKLNLQRNDTFSLIRKDYESIRNAFNGTTSESIELLKSKIDRNVTSLLKRLTILIESSKSIANNVSVAENITNSYDLQLSDNHSNSDLLKLLLQKYVNIGISVNETVILLPEMNKTLTESGIIVDDNLLVLQKDVDSLRNMLKEQEKQDFIDANVPKLQYILQKAINDTNQAELEVEEMNEGINSLDTQYESTDVLTSNMSSLAIPLNNSKNVIDSANKSLNRYQLVLNDGRQLIESMDLTNLYRNGSFFSLNDTLEDIKDVFDNLKQSLQSVSANMSNLIQEKHDLKQKVSKEDIYLKEINSESLKLRNLTKAHESSKQELEEIGNQIDNSVKNASRLANDKNYLDNRLADIVKTYKNVKKKSLYNDVNMILKELISLGDGYAILNTSINNTIEKHIDANNETDELEKNINRVSISLDELKEKIYLANPMQDEITKGLISINSNTKDLPYLMQQKLEMIPLINESIDKLQENFRKQEIHEYMKENFPSLLKNYDIVNKTLSDLKKRTVNATKKMSGVWKQNIEFEQRLNDFHSVNLSLEDLISDINHGNASLKDVIHDTNLLEGIFLDMENVISNSVDSNETLDDIKTRFSGYESILQNLSTNITELNHTVSEVDSAMNHILSTIENHTNALNDFRIVQNDAEKEEQSMRTLKQLIENVEDDLHMVETKTDSENSRFVPLSVRFGKVNNTLLNNERERIGQSILTFNHSLTDTRSSLDNEKIKFGQLLQNKEILKQELNQNITTIDQLKAISKSAADKVTELSDYIQIIALNVSNDIRSDMAPFNVTISVIEEDISNLQNDYLEQEKKDFLLANLPHLKQLYDSVNKSLTETNNNLNRSAATNHILNESIENLQKMINLYNNIKISTDGDILQQQSLQENITMGNVEMNDAMDGFINLDTDIFERKDWSNISIDEMKDVCDDFMKNISLINNTLNDVKFSISAIENAQNKSFNSLNETKYVLDRFQKSLKGSDTNKEGLQNISVKLNETHKLLEDVKDRFYNDGDRLFNLTRKYSDTTSSSIENMIDEIRTIIEGTVGLRIPLANKLFSKRIMENYNVVSSRFDDVIYVLNDNYTNKDDIKNILGDVDETLMNITLETEDMVANEQFYREDAIRLSEHLNNSNSLLDKLEEMFEVQAKLDLLNENVPKLTNYWNEVNDSQYAVSDTLPLTSGDIKDALIVVKDLKEEIDQIVTVNISTENLRSKLTLQESKLKSLNESVMQNLQDLDAIPLFKISVDAIANNKSVSVNDVQEILTKLNISITSLKNRSNDLANLNQDLKVEFLSTRSDMMSLNNTIYEFKNSEKDVNDLNVMLNQTFGKLNETASQLNETDNQINVYKKSLEGLNQKYKDYTYDIKDIEVLIDIAEKSIATQNKSLLNADAMLEESKDEYEVMRAVMYNKTDDISMLNDSIKQIKNSMPSTVAKVKDINRSLDNITDNIPDMNNLLQDLSGLIHEMNVSLQNEDLKSNFADKALPLLKEKYESTNRTFDMTNKTLQRMADEIEMLNDYIETLKLRMTDFSTINISLSDIDANITHLENRLAIMKEHYDNVKGVVNKFRNDISINNIFGRNISLSDVEDQYKTFNDSLDLIDEVLAKIDNEAYKMDEHFEFLNDTMSGIDNALDRFETKQMNTKIMEKDIEIIGTDLTSTNETINNMQSVVNEFRERFDKMNDLYADVLQTTSENNAIVNTLLETTNSSLAGLHSSVTKLDDIYSKVTRGFSEMNGTLFEQIDTYTGLNDTLDDVKIKYLKLSKSLVKLEKDINDAKQEASGKNATLSELSTLLDLINETLYIEKLKFDFINDNLGNMANKFNSIKSPLKTTNKTLSDVTDNISNTSDLIEGVSKKLQEFSNVHISLINETNKLLALEKNVTNVNTNLKELGNQYEILQKNITDLDDPSGDVKDIQKRYKSINESLDNLQTNLTEMMTDLHDINNNANAISNKTVKLNSALDKLNGLNNSIVSLGKNVSKLETDFETTSSIINDTYSDAKYLKGLLEEMEDLYSSLGDDVLLGNLTDLINKLNITSQGLGSIKTLQNNLIDNATGTITTLKETRKQLNGAIYDQEMLDNVNLQSEKSLNHLTGGTLLLQDSQNGIADDAIDLRNTIDLLTNEMLRLNETLAEEKKKKEFIAKNFPDMQRRYDKLNTILDKSNTSITKAKEKTETVAERLSNVKDRLNNITAITIPLDSETNEVFRIQKAIDDVFKKFENVSKVYDGLKLDQLNRTDMKYTKMKNKYIGFDKAINDIEENINKMHDVLNDINKTTSVINESVYDINTTVDEYLESGEMINDYAMSSENLSDNIENTNHSIGNFSDEVQLLHDTLNNLLQNYSHINDPAVKQARNTIQTLLNSSSMGINKIGKEILNLKAGNEKTKSVLQKMNQTHLTTKNLLSELKQHIKDIKNNSRNVNARLNDTETDHISINNSLDALSPNLKNILDMISNLNDTLVNEQVKLDFIAANKPLIEKKFRDLLGPLERTNNHISFTEVKLVDLKYEIKTTGSRLGKFKTLNFTTDPELQRWNNMNHTVKNVSKTFQELNENYKKMQGFFKTIDDRNISIEEMKQKFASINSSLNNIEGNLENVNTKLSLTETEIRETENTIGDLQTSMDNFKLLQTDAVKTKRKVNDLLSIVGRSENSTNDVSKAGADIKQNLEDMKTTYDVLNNTNWNKMQQTFDKDISAGINNLNQANESLIAQRSKLQSTAITFDDISSEISTRHLTRKDLDLAISDMHKRLNSTKQQLSGLDKPLRASKQKLSILSATMNQTKIKVDAMNKTLHRELQKHDFVRQNLPSLKEKYTKINASYVNNIPNLHSMEDQISQLVSIIERIKEKMRQYGVDDTDNSIKKWDIAIQSLKSTVANVLRKNKEAGDKLINLKDKLWSNSTMYSSNESLADVITRFGNYNKTLDEINAAAHTINIKLADLDAEASGVIGQLLERDSILTTTPATTTPSGPPDWLTFQSTATGIIGKDGGFATCAVEDLTQWDIMKITRVNKDGKEEAIAAWKLGVGARKAVRDRRIKVKRTKTATGGKMMVGIKTLQCEDEGTYYCSIDTYNMWPLQSSIGVTTPPEDDLKPDFPTEVFEDKVANFSCMGHPGYPNGRITWKIKREKEVEFRPFDFYSSRSMVTDTSCVRTETNKVEYQFDLQWNNTKVRCYIENTDFHAEGIIRLLPYDICNKVRYLGTISHPYTPHKYIVCGKELNIMQCPGNTCYDQTAENCVRCKAGSVGSDPCLGQPLFSYVAHETDCKKYYICMGPTKNAKKCTKGYFAPNIPGNCVMSYAQSHCGRKAG